MSLARPPLHVTFQGLCTLRTQQRLPVLSAQKQTSRELEEEESAIEAFKAAVSCLMPFADARLSPDATRKAALEGLTSQTVGAQCRLEGVRFITEAQPASADDDEAETYAEALGLEDAQPGEMLADAPVFMVQ